MQISPLLAQAVNGRARSSESHAGHGEEDEGEEEDHSRQGGEEQHGWQGMVSSKVIARELMSFADQWITTENIRSGTAAGRYCCWAALRYEARSGEVTIHPAGLITLMCCVALRRVA